MDIILESSMGAVISVGGSCYAFDAITYDPATHQPSDVQAIYADCGTCQNPAVRYMFVPCVYQGACCLPNGTCSFVTEADCLASSGVYQGDRTQCSSTVCSQPSAQCCLPDGTCQTITSVACAGSGGTWGGYGTSCVPNTCPQPSAQCCLADGTCQTLTSAQCGSSGGTWGGYGTSCSPNTCPQPSAQCCLADGTCQMITSAACAASSGTWGGYGTSCSPNTCPQPSAACCIGSSCSMLTSADCALAGGSWQGFGVDCDPDPCSVGTPGYLANGDGVKYCYAGQYSGTNYYTQGAGSRKLFWSADYGGYWWISLELYWVNGQAIAWCSSPMTTYPPLSGWNGAVSTLSDTTCP
jgi:hypothetical protein